MRAAVRNAFPGFSARFEGLVTTGLGNLIDSVADAVALPWLHANGVMATQSEISTEWHFIKSAKSLASKGGLAFRSIATLHLDEDGIDALVTEKMNADCVFLCRRFDQFETWPADAQLGTLSLAWADGPYFRFPHFQAAAELRDWATCSVQSHLDEHGNPGLHPRNIANAVCFMNAAAVEAVAGDFEELHYPAQLPAITAAPPSTKP
jgi:hypothetical protein